MDDPENELVRVHGYPPTCKCGNKAIGWTISEEVKTGYCSECDPDPDVDMSDECYLCGNQSHRSSYVGSGIYLGVCRDCDSGQILGLEHLGGE